MLVSLIFSFILIMGYYFPSFKEDIALKMDSINFSELLLEVC
jgi:CPA1 family monovalent cation:H+ antiporter